MVQIVSVLPLEAGLYGVMRQEPQSTLDVMAAAGGMGWGGKIERCPCCEVPVLGDPVREECCGL